MTSGSGFFITILLAHFIGLKGYGDYTKVTTFVAIFYLIADFGLNAIFLKLNEKEARLNYLLSLRLLIALLLIIIINVVVIFLPSANSQDIGFASYLRLPVFIFTLTIIFQSVLFTSMAVFQKKLKYDLQMYSIICGTILTLFLVIAFSLKQMPLEYILISYVLGNALSAVISLILIKQKFTPLKFNTTFYAKLLKDSSPIGLMLFFNLIYFRADIIILSFYKSVSDVALYGYAYKYFEFLLALPLFLSNAVYPFLLRSLKNLRNFHQLAQKYILVFLILSILILGFAWFLSPLIAIVEKDFSASILILRTLVFFLPVFFVTSILQWILIAKDENKFLLLTYSLSALINIALNIIFIPIYGYLAAAIITGLSELFILAILLMKFIGQKQHKTYTGKIYES